MKHLLNSLIPRGSSASLAAQSSRALSTSRSWDNVDSIRCSTEYLLSFIPYEASQQQTGEKKCRRTSLSSRMIFARPKAILTGLVSTTSGIFLSNIWARLHPTPIQSLAVSRVLRVGSAGLVAVSGTVPTAS